MDGAFGRFASFDIAVLREMYRTGEVTVAGVDPRLNVSRIAERLGCSRAKVAARLAVWSEIGFLRRYEVWPNPALFGLSGASIDLRLEDRLRKPELFERLALLDGAVGAIEFLGPWVTYQYVFPDEATRERRQKLLRSLEGIAEVGEPIRWGPVPPKRRLGALDLRIVRALRAAPSASLTEIARSVGVSTRTITARYGKLVAEWAVWFIPVFDFTKLPGPVVSLVLGVDRPERHAELRRKFRRAYPDSLQFGWGGFGPVEDRGVAVFFVYLPSAAAVEEVERVVGAWEGVTAVEASVLVRILSFEAGLDELLKRVTVDPSVE